MAVPYTFGSATSSIPLSQLDSNFATTITLGNTAIQLGNTVTTLNNMTLANVTISSGTSNLATTAITNGTSNVTIASSGGNIAMATNGTTAITIDTSQRVGIGTTTTSNATLTVTNANLTSPLYIGSQSDSSTWGGFFVNGDTSSTAGNGIYGKSGASFYYNVATGLNHLWTINGGEVIRINGNGALLIGTTTTTYNERFAASTNSATADSNIAYFVHKGTNSPRGYRVEFSNAAPNNTTQTFTIFGDNVANRFVVYSNGNVVNTNNSYGALSDVKLKENITDATPKLNGLMQVRVVNYNLIGEQTKQLGVVAQELEQIFPGMVDESPDTERVTTTDENGNEITNEVPTGSTTKSVKYSVFVPMLIKAMQEQQALITQLKADVAALQAKVGA